jgi:hypothetical protein
MLSHYEYDLLKAPAGRTETALLVGTVVHAAFEALLMGGDWEAAAAEVLMLASGDADSNAAAIACAEAEQQWGALHVAITHGWKTPEDWEVLAVEKELEVPCGVHTVVGRLDALVRWNGSLWHLQHKTVPTNKALAVYAEQQRTDWHECVYQRMAEGRYENVAGTLLNCIRKVSLKTARERPLSAFESFFLPRSEDQINEAFADIEQEINDIQAEQDGTRRIIKNRSFCAGQYGNRICAFKEVCDGIVQIDDADRFINVEPRYSGDSPGGDI